MAKFKIYKLHFTAPLHISDQHAEGSISQKTIHSDTLYAALTSCLAKVGTEIPADGDLGFAVSGLFPYYQEKTDSTPVYFLPMPMKASPPELKDVSKAKSVKKVQWVDANLYADALAGEKFFDGADSLVDNIQNSYLTMSVLPKDTEGSSEFVVSQVVQRVTIDDRTGRSDALPYYVDRVGFRDMSGLYFIADGDTTLLDKAMAILAEEGIGTDRNVGFGFFDYSSQTINIDIPADADHVVSLSVFIPESNSQMQEMLDSDKVAYDFARRGGWITTYPYITQRKNAVYAFMPGSVFKKPDGLCGMQIGKITNLRPDIGEISPKHPIWRSGKAILLPIKFK